MKKYCKKNIKRVRLLLENSYFSMHERPFVPIYKATTRAEE